MYRSALLFVVAVRAFAADPFFFVQASDPQFGMFTSNKSFEQETSNWEFVIANVNRLHPAFLVITGDLTNKDNDAAQIAELKRINKTLDPSIHLYLAPGNHDVTNAPTPETLAAYRANHGADYYSFREGPVYGIVLNSTILKAPEKVMDEAAREEKWLEQELVKAQAANATTIVFMHHPPFVEKADEPSGENIPPETRARLLALLHKYGVHYVFAGHLHHNASASDGDLEVNATSASGKPIGKDPSGVRLVQIVDGKAANTFFSLGTLPPVFPVPAPAAK